MTSSRRSTTLLGMLRGTPSGLANRFSMVVGGAWLLILGLLLLVHAERLQLGLQMPALWRDGDMVLVLPFEWMGTLAILCAPLVGYLLMPTTKEPTARSHLSIAGWLAVLLGLSALLVRAAVESRAQSGWAFESPALPAPRYWQILAWGAVYAGALLASLDVAWTWLRHQRFRSLPTLTSLAACLLVVGATAQALFLAVRSGFGLWDVAEPLGLWDPYQGRFILIGLSCLAILAAVQAAIHRSSSAARILAMGAIVAALVGLWPLHYFARTDTSLYVHDTMLTWVPIYGSAGAMMLAALSLVARARRGGWVIAGAVAGSLGLLGAVASCSVLGARGVPMRYLEVHPDDQVFILVAAVATAAWAAGTLLVYVGRKTDAGAVGRPRESMKSERPSTC